jgi:hypothetical protein
MSTAATEGMEPEKVPFSVYVGRFPEVGSNEDISAFIREQREDEEEGGEK